MSDSQGACSACGAGAEESCKGPWHPRRAFTAQDAIYTAWTIIANARDWVIEDEQAKEWVEAATRWRDEVLNPALNAALAQPDEAVGA
jgi:hypothetical protein